MRLSSLLNWIGKNLATLFLAFGLALIVWISAVVTADPNVVDVLAPVPVELVGQDPALLLVGEVPTQASLTLEAPSSIWTALKANPDLASAWIDLTGLGSGEHEVQIKTSIAASPVRYILVDPEKTMVMLEPLTQVELPVTLVVNGSLPLGYRKGEASLDPQTVTISGPQSQVEKVVEARSILNVSGAVEPVEKQVPVEPLDKDGVPVTGVTLTPGETNVVQPIDLLGGFKNVVIKVVTTGQVANGYRLTNISVAPPTVTLFAENPQLLNEVPGYVDTLPVDLDNLTDDIVITAGLNLPEGITSVRESTVLVQVSVAAIEGSMTITVPVEVFGLSPDLMATISPETVDIIIAGPLNILEKLDPNSIRVVLDLTGLPPGIYRRSPVVEQLPALVRVQTTLPETVEVAISLAPTPTSIITGTLTLTPTVTPLITP